MMIRVLYILFLFIFPEAYAGVIRLNYLSTLNQDYTIENITNTYKVTGSAFGLDYFSSSDASSFLTRGFGIQKGSFLAKEKQIENSLLFPLQFKYETYQAHYIFAMQLASFQLEVPLSLNMLQETTGANKGDEKYGYGYGFQLHYRLFNHFTLGIGHETQLFPYGKNASTDKKGSLAYPIKTSANKIYIAYFINFGGFGDAIDSAVSGGGGDGE